jgi:S1-C subfamily serine protease
MTMLDAMTRLPRHLLALLLLLACAPAAAADYGAAIASIKPSVVAVATYADNRSPRVRMAGTGFAVADGRHVVTNAHVIDKKLAAGERWVVVRPRETGAEVRPVISSVPRPEHDIALLKVAEPALPALALGNSDAVSDGRDLAFTGYPLGLVMGLYPVTHRAFLAGVVPFNVPTVRGSQLTAKGIKARRRGNFSVFQLDATAFPGNSGSPLYDPADRKVYGIVSMVFRGGVGSNPAEQPSGITFAVPASHIVTLLREQGLTP